MDGIWRVEVASDNGEVIELAYDPSVAQFVLGVRRSGEELASPIDDFYLEDDPALEPATLTAFTDELTAGLARRRPDLARYAAMLASRFAGEHPDIIES